MDIEEEETADKAATLSKTQPKDGDEMNDSAEAKVEVDEDEDEDDVQVPENMPEDAFFIPLGLVRQLPHTHYKGSDPEWQSFVEFGRNRERTTAVRSRFASTLFFGTIPNIVIRGVGRHGLFACCQRERPTKIHWRTYGIGESLARYHLSTWPTTRI